MSPLAPFRKWSLSAAISATLVVTLVVVGLPGVARADLGDEPSSKSKSSSSSDGMGQVDDGDKPKDPSLLDKKPADAAVAQKQQAAAGPPFYSKWQFWVITVAVVAATVGVIVGGQALFHQLNGGDVRPCNPDFKLCFGEGH